MQLLISWVEPAETNGELSYIRSVVCERQYDSAITFNETLTVDASERTFTISREPHTLCTVTVMPQTGAGMGPSSVEMLQTDEEGEIAK